MFEIIWAITFEPFLSACQAFAAILYPTKSPRLIRAQRWAGTLLLLGILGVVASFVVGLVGLPAHVLAVCLFAGIAFLAVAGTVGRSIEKSVEEVRKSKQREPARPDANPR